MLPRKRQRPNPQKAGAASAPSQSQERTAAHASPSTSGAANAQAQAPAAAHNDGPMSRPNPANGNGSINGSKSSSNRQNHKQVRKAQSWYGSWPRPPKASASTSVAKENILGDKFRTQRPSEFSRPESRSADDSVSVHSTAGSVSLSTHSKQGAQEQPPPAEDQALQKQRDSSKLGSSSDANQTSTEPAAAPNDQAAAASKAQPDDNTQPTSTEDSQVQPQTPARTPARTPAPAPPQPTWFEWLTSTPAPTAPNPTETPPPVPDIQLRPSTPPSQAAPAEPTSPKSEPRPTPLSSWFSFWTAPISTNMKPDSEKDAPKGDQQAKPDDDVVMQDAPPAPNTQQGPPPKAGSTWAFWSRDSPTSKGKKATHEPGEIAVIGEGSETHPLPMAEDNVSTEAKNAKTPSKAKDQKSTWRKNKRVRPASMDDLPSPSPATSTTSLPDQATAPEKEPPPEAAKAGKKVEPSTKSLAESELPAKPTTNLLLPSFASTYQMKQNPSIIQQISNLLLRTSQAPVNHVFKVQEPPKIRKALAIGVHGLFPATYLRPMIGQPTGTSLRFASLCADAIRRWTDSHGCQNCEIEKVALEGEGRISDRVENLWKLLLNWIDVIRKADLIVMASHSQGVPVSIMLLEKLIDLGIITNAKIGVCAMAGVALGPFPDYKSSFLMGSAAELWDFGIPQSQNSQRFEAALKRVLDYGARVTFIGSIDDQVVPMESAVYSPASHPYIYRAVFIDGRIHAPDFIAHLVGFALKLRNLGVSDHGLVRELSLALAGSLYSGEGHSRLYFDSAVYDLAVSHALETTSISQSTPCQIQHRSAPSPSAAGSSTTTASAALASPNPYVLPWIMRGLLEEDFVKTELSKETEVLLQQFDDWKPSNKALKDVKYRLEAVRSKL